MDNMFVKRDAPPYNRNLDAEVARYVFGWTVFPDQREFEWGYNDYPNATYASFRLPYFARDINEAWSIVEQMAAWESLHDSSPQAQIGVKFTQWFNSANLWQHDSQRAAHEIGKKAVELTWMLRSEDRNDAHTR